MSPIFSAFKLIKKGCYELNKKKASVLIEISKRESNYRKFLMEANRPIDIVYGITKCLEVYFFPFCLIESWSHDQSEYTNIFNK